MRQRVATSTAVTALALIAALAAAMPADAEMFKIENAGEALLFYPTQEAKGFQLTITGPCRYEYRSRVEKGEMVFKLPKDAMDGAYSYSIDVVPEIDPKIMEILAEARETGNDKRVRELCREGQLPSVPAGQSGSFAVVEQRIVLDTTPEEKRGERDEGEKSADLLLDSPSPGNDELAERFRAADEAPTSGSAECLWASRLKPLGLQGR